VEGGLLAHRTSPLPGQYGERFVDRWSDRIDVEVPGADRGADDGIILR